MAAVAPSFEQCGVRIGEDAVKGKVVYAERDIAVGEVIFSEEAFVFAPWGTDVCDGCEEEKTPEKPECYCDKNGMPKEMYSETLTKNVELRKEVVDHMAATFESIAEIDHARCVLKCLALYERDNKALDEVMKLTCTNYEHCLEDAKELHEHLPQIFPKDFTDEQMATLIGVLNANSHELENLGGSGLFMSACRMEHNCDANCSFTTYDSTLWLTAIRPIKKGDALSIDYGNFYYRPTEERMSSLFESYGFVCTCDKCMKEPDTCRAFKCSNSSCTDGVVYPYPITPAGPIEDPEELEFSWKCSACGQVPSDEEQASYEEEEQELLEKGFPDSLVEVDEIVKKTSLHERHYLLFWAMDAIGCGAAAMSSVVDQTEEERKELAEIWERIISHMNALIPGPHHEKTIYYDNLAQVQVVLNNRNAAMDAYRQAYEVSCIVSGRECTPTRKLKDLSENPPADAEELKKLYANTKRRLDMEVEWEDDDDEEEEEEEEE